VGSGSEFMKKLAEQQLHGELKVSDHNGVKIEVIWSDNEA
jgi:two-component sensor histidine kinase